jgi:hypothetical protein
MSTLLDAHFVIVNGDRDQVLTLAQESMCHLVSLLPLVSNANPQIRDPSTRRITAAFFRTDCGSRFAGREARKTRIQDGQECLFVCLANPDWPTSLASPT